MIAVMEWMPWPLGAEEQRLELLLLVERSVAAGKYALLRFVQVHDAGTPWRFAFGRIDLALPADLPEPAEADVTVARTVVEKMQGSEFLARLRAAFRAEDFLCRSEQFDHKPFVALAASAPLRRYSEKTDNGFDWPCREFTADLKSWYPQPKGKLVGTVGTAPWDDVDAFVFSVSGLTALRSANGGEDARLRRLTLFDHDYFGRIKNVSWKPRKPSVTIALDGALDDQLVWAGTGAPGPWQDGASMPAASTVILPVASRTADVRIQLGSFGAPITDERLLPAATVEKLRVGPSSGKTRKTKGRTGANFSKETRRTLALRAQGRCSKPDCREATSGPHSEKHKAVNLGEASHIKGAAPGSARYDPSQTDEERRDIDNGIWLCRRHAKLVDADKSKYTVDLLRAWKHHAEQEADLGAEGNSGRHQGVLSERAPQDTTPIDHPATLLPKPQEPGHIYFRWDVMVRESEPKARDGWRRAYRHCTVRVVSDDLCRSSFQQHEEYAFLAQVRSAFPIDASAELEDPDPRGIRVRHVDPELRFDRTWTWGCAGLLGMAVTLAAVRQPHVYSLADIAHDVARFLQMTSSLLGEKPVYVWLELGAADLPFMFRTADTAAVSRLDGFVAQSKPGSTDTAFVQKAFDAGTLLSNHIAAATGELLQIAVTRVHRDRVDRAQLVRFATESLAARTP